MVGMDYEVHHFTRRCAATGRELREGESFYSVLIHEADLIVRHDYSIEAWPGPHAEGVVAWWKSQVPSRAAKKAQLAPNDVLWEYFQELEADENQQDTLYVLSLLLIRRRVLRVEEREVQPDGSELMVLYAPRDETTHRVRDAAPTPERIAEIEQQLTELLYTTAH